MIKKIFQLTHHIISILTSPSKWRDTINSLGYELKIDYEVDFRQDIADSWPKKVDDSLLRKDIDWIPKFNEKETALDFSNQFNFKLTSVDIYYWEPIQFLFTVNQMFCAFGFIRICIFCIFNNIIF